jgi:hypothetical protein
MLWRLLKGKKRCLFIRLLPSFISIISILFFVFSPLIESFVLTNLLNFFPAQISSINFLLGESYTISKKTQLPIFQRNFFLLSLWVFIIGEGGWILFCPLLSSVFWQVRVIWESKFLILENCGWKLFYQEMCFRIL